jgi:hypothetical protein
LSMIHRLFTDHLMFVLVPIKRTTF